MSDKLIHRLNRIQGQIEALKRHVETESFDQEKCVQNLQLLKASINGLKKFGAAYVAQHVQSCIESGDDEAELEALVLMAVNTGFDL